jgi:hypothetical protein
MQAHCEMVNNFGFGSHAEVLKNLEETMCEIWIETLGVLEFAPAGSSTV